MLSNNDPTASSGIPEPITPKKAIGLPTESTPTQYKQSTALPFTSGHVMRDETLVALGNEMVGYVVCPMPAVEFLEFLPRSTEVMPSFDKKPLAILAEAKSESQMYNPFIEAMKDFCPNLTGINTSNTQMTTFSGKTIKPDITYFKALPVVKGKAPVVKGKAPVVNSSDVGGAELMIEVKFSQSDDPFKDVPTAEGFLSDSDRPRQTLGQVTSYATAHLAAQFRTHVFSILLFRRSARLMRWDRAGVIVSQRISLDSPALALFFWRFNSADASARGHDTTVTPFIFTETLTKKFLYDQLLFAADPGEVKMEDVKFFEMLLPRENNRYVIGKATYLGLASLASRATRSFKAWCLTKEKAVLLKDTWRILSSSLSPEHETYEKLATAKVRYIATVLDHSDLEGHRTITGDYAQKSWACKFKLKPFRTLQHYRLVLNEIGRNLTSFEKFPEVLAAMRCALQAHRESYYNGNVLHRDISAGNILIYKNGGLLIDWDMSKYFGLESDKEKNEKNILRSGTWAFQSLRLSKRPKKDEPQLVNGRLDDLESFYHVLFWVSLQHARHGLNPADLYDYLTRLFDHAVIDGDNKAFSNHSKVSHMKSRSMLEDVEFQNSPLLELLFKLSDTFKVLYIPAPKSFKIQIPPLKKIQRTLESYQMELESYNEVLKFLNSDEDANWMEVYFKDALDDEWGPAEYTEYISNEMTPPPFPNTKRKFSDMTSSYLSVRHNQGGTFLPSDQSAEADDDQDATMNEDEDFEDYDMEGGGGNDEENISEPSSSRRRYN